MDEATIVFWGIDALLAGFILWRLYFLYKDSRKCPNGMRPSEPSDTPPVNLPPILETRTVSETIDLIEQDIKREGESLASGSTTPTPVLDTFTGSTTLPLNLINKLFPGAAAAAAASAKEEKRPKIPANPEEQKELQEFVDKIPLDFQSYFDDVKPKPNPPPPPKIMEVPQEEILIRKFIR